MRWEILFFVCFIVVHHFVTALNLLMHVCVSQECTATVILMAMMVQLQNAHKQIHKTLQFATSPKARE